MRTRTSSLLLLLACLAAFFAIPASAGAPILDFLWSVAAGLSADNITVKVAAPLAAAPTRSTNTSIASASWTEFPGTDLASQYRTGDIAQLLVVTNFDTTARICVDFPDRITGDPQSAEDNDCADNCTNLSSTCDGSSTDGDMILPNQQREFRPSGALCICYRASVANADGQFSMVAR